MISIVLTQFRFYTFYHVVTPVGVKHTLEYKRSNKRDVPIDYSLIEPCPLQKRWQMFFLVLCKQCVDISIFMIY